MKRNIYRRTAAAGLLALSTLGLICAGCSTAASSSSTSAGGVTSKKAALSNQSGATLWAQNCGHCHNIRSPDSLSDAQWDVVVLHMRVRANLTAEEHRQILAFLKSAH